MVGTEDEQRRHHQARREDDQRGDQLDGPAPDGHHGRAATAPATTACAAAPTTRASCSPGPTSQIAVMGRRAGSPACCRSSSRRRRAAEAAARGDRRGGTQGAWSRPDRAASRRRCTRPARLYDDGVIDPRDTRTVPRHLPVRVPQRPECGGTRRLRRVPDVSARAMTSSDPRRSRKLLVANRGEIARRVDAHLPRAWASPPSPVFLGRRRATTPYVAEADEAVRAGRGRRRPRRTCAIGDPRRGPRAPAPTPSTPATASSSENAAFADACDERRPDLGRPAGPTRSRRWARRSRPSASRPRPACPLLPGCDGDEQGTDAADGARGRDRLPAAGQGVAPAAAARGMRIVRARAELADGRRRGARARPRPRSATTRCSSSG